PAKSQLRTQFQAARCVGGAAARGTLIDGSGGEPVPNKLLVVEGNGSALSVKPRARCDRKPQTRVIDATGKFILPGLIEWRRYGAGFLRRAARHDEKPPLARAKRAFRTSGTSQTLDEPPPKTASRGHELGQHLQPLCIEL